MVTWFGDKSLPPDQPLIHRVSTYVNVIRDRLRFFGFPNPLKSWSVPGFLRGLSPVFIVVCPRFSPVFVSPVFSGFLNDFIRFALEILSR